MKTLKAIKIAGLSSMAAFVLIPSVSLADVSKNNATVGAGGHSLVQHVSHSIAGAADYTRGSEGSFKWGKTAEVRESEYKWSNSSAPKSGNKWASKGQNMTPAASSIASSSSYQWGVKSFSDQSAFRWGLRSNPEQSAFRWGLRSNADQSAFRWGLRSTSDQKAFRWGLRSSSDQKAFRWGLRSYSEQKAFRWGLRSNSEQSAFRWGLR